MGNKISSFTKGLKSATSYTKTKAEKHSSNILEWIVMIAYIVIAYFIGVAGIKVHDLCDDSDENFKEKGGGKSTAQVALIMTTFFILTFLFIIFVARDSIIDGPLSCWSEAFFSEYNSFKDPRMKIAGVTFACFCFIFGLLSIFLTSATIFTSFDTQKACDVAFIQDEEKRKEFENWEQFVTILWGYTIGLLVLLGLWILIKVGQEVKNSMNTPSLSFFGRRRVRKRRL